MFDMTRVFFFLTAAVLLAIAPGPGMLYVLARSLAGGKREGVRHDRRARQSGCGAAGAYEAQIASERPRVARNGAAVENDLSEHGDRVAVDRAALMDDDIAVVRDGVAVDRAADVQCAVGDRDGTGGVASRCDG